eukprot:COSAG01_NODE_294_length_19294_cov_35.559312_17_plen_80_part_00
MLETLSLEGCANICGRGLSSLKLLLSLTHLNLSQLRNLSDEAMGAVGRFTELRTLQLVSEGIHPIHPIHPRKQTLAPLS